MVGRKSDLVLGILGDIILNPIGFQRKWICSLIDFLFIEPTALGLEYVTVQVGTEISGFCLSLCSKSILEQNVKLACLLKCCRHVLTLITNLLVASLRS